jgi:hypothetical protein
MKIDFLKILVEAGFKPMDMEEHFGKDHGLKEVVYLHNIYQHNHQYISLMYYEGRFLEAVFEAYWVAKNPKHKKINNFREAQLRGFAKIGGSIYREIDELMNATKYEYQPEKEKTI